MTTEINYRKSGSAAKQAWFKFKKSHPEMATSVTQFIAGWNAAMAEAKSDESRQVLNTNKKDKKVDTG